ncbi:MAG: HU family DNA-binding protein [Anaerorhabdus sp.]
MTDIKTKKLLAEEVSNKFELSKKDANEIVNYIFEEMSTTLKNGGTVDINAFGKFTVKERAARDGINPLTKEKIKIKATKVAGFKASKTLKDLVAGKR